MVTGDHPITAKAIARAVGIFSPDSETIEDIAIRKKCKIEEVNQRLIYKCITVLFFFLTFQISFEFIF